ncbi:ankyrin repeat-containing protein [Anaeramoeba flamelloides]|uniref:Ankyrin repeat-containing protein n=1 Tax=Anaeramoeba flamelloides TaxID=1746091 RepID=A0ABQ8Y2I7_9EUKA|nr:ankyrin repeat-containing protein [Anaeramoeba flamelloides]
MDHFRQLQFFPGFDQITKTNINFFYCEEGSDLATTPLIHSINQSKYKTIERLVSLGADVNLEEKSNIRDTPLHKFAYRKNLTKEDKDCLLYLTANGANPFLHKRLEETPLYYLLEFFHIKPFFRVLFGLYKFESKKKQTNLTIEILNKTSTIEMVLIFKLLQNCEIETLNWIFKNDTLEERLLKGYFKKDKHTNFNILHMLVFYLILCKDKRILPDIVKWTNQLIRISNKKITRRLFNQRMILKIGVLHLLCIKPESTKKTKTKTKQKQKPKNIEEEEIKQKKEIHEKKEKIEEKERIEEKEKFEIGHQIKLIFKALVQSGNKIGILDSFDRLPIFYFCRNSNCNTKLLRYLLKNQNSEILCQTDQYERNCFEYFLNNKLNVAHLELFFSNWLWINYVNEKKQSILHTNTLKKKPSTKLYQYIVSHPEFKLINQQDNEGKTIFHYICERIDEFPLPIIKYLLDNNLDMNIQDYHGHTGLLLLTKRDKAPIEVLRVMLQRGADANFKPTYTYNAFQNILINYENFEPYLELLIEHGAMIDENSNTQSREETNFVYKLYSERIILSFEKYQYLKKHGYDVATMQFTDLKTILHFECQRNDPDIALVKYLINSDSVNIQDKFGRTAFFYYCKRSPNNYSRGKIRYEVVELFIKGGLHLNLNLNFERGVPLIQLLYKRDIDFNIIRLLIQNKANINIYSKPQLRSPLHLLCISGDPSKEKLKYFIKNGSRVNSLDSDQNIPLFYLLENSNCSYSSILYLIKQGSNLHNVNKYNENIYHFLFNNDSELAFMEQLIRIVLKEKVDLNLKSCKGIYPINLLSDNHHISYKLIKLFSDHGCYLNVFDQFANNPLSLSCQNEKLSFNTIKFLIDQKLNVNSQNLDLQTPLHYICKNPNTSPRFIELLVKSGANIHVRDNKGVAPYQYIYYGNMELIPIIKIFMENGLDINDTNECLDNTSFFF